MKLSQYNIIYIYSDCLSIYFNLNYSAIINQVDVEYCSSLTNTYLGAFNLKTDPYPINLRPGAEFDVNYSANVRKDIPKGTRIKLTVNKVVRPGTVDQEKKVPCIDLENVSYFTEPS